MTLHIQNEVTLEGLKHILEGHAEFSVSNEIQKTGADVVITDVLPPGLGLKHKQRKPRFILWQDSKEYRPGSVLREDVTAILDGGCAREEVILAVRRAAEGKKFVSSSFAETLTTNVISGREGLKLSPREEEVLKKISAGHTLTSIAEEMSLSINTISTYQTRIIKKLRLKTAGDLIRYTMKNNI